MILRGATGDALEITLDGYRFPNGGSSEAEANWLEVRIDAVAASRAWAIVDPKVMTWEVEQLAAWLDATAAGAAERLVLAEPGLAFAVAESVVRVAYEDSEIELDGDPAVLRAAAADLRAQLARFPARG